MTYSILINTCDKFDDCWDPFFKLWTIYWPDCKGKLYLNTEYKNYTYPGLDITPVKGCETHRIPTTKRAMWSQCLKWALQTIDSDIILYMQEDYFLNGKVNNAWVEHFLSVMYDNPEIPCIQITDVGIPAKEKSPLDLLYYSDPNYFSYVSCQTGFWRKDILMSLIREHETAWNFEWWGSKRAKHLGYQFLVVDPHWLNTVQTPIFPYLATGVIGGRWYKPVVELFALHHITIDYNLRGFHQVIKPSIKKRIKLKLSIWKVKSILEIWKLALKRYL